MSVHECAGGPKALAARMELAYSTLQNMADPKQPAHGWPLARFRQLLAFTGDTRPLQALCTENGGVFVPLGATPARTDSELLRAVQRLSAEFGDVPRAIQDALGRDGKISTNELRRIEREGMELVQALTVVLQRVGDLHRQHAIVPEDDRP